MCKQWTTGNEEKSTATELNQNNMMERVTYYWEVTHTIKVICRILKQTILLTNQDFRYFDKVNNQYQTLKRVERVKDQLTKLRQRNEVGIQYAKLSIAQQNHNLFN